MSARLSSKKRGLGHKSFISHRLYVATCAICDENRIEKRQITYICAEVLVYFLQMNNRDKEICTWVINTPTLATFSEIKNYRVAKIILTDYHWNGGKVDMILIFIILFVFFLFCITDWNLITYICLNIAFGLLHISIYINFNILFIRFNVAWFMVTNVAFCENRTYYL